MEAALMSFLSAYLFLGCLLGYRVAGRFTRNDAKRSVPLTGPWLGLAQIAMFMMVVIFWIPIMFAKMWEQSD